MSVIPRDSFLKQSREEWVKKYKWEVIKTRCESSSAGVSIRSFDDRPSKRFFAIFSNLSELEERDAAWYISICGKAKEFGLKADIHQNQIYIFRGKTN